jgi:[histone H3]-lysine36 N-dimethyltransferase SETMAR
MGKRYLSNKWIPHFLTDANKAKRMETCQQLLDLYHDNNFLHRLITADESWVFWENTGSHHNKSWRGSGDEPVVDVKGTLTNKKHLLSVFWDSKGVILLDVLPRGMTITAEYYCGLLDKLKTAVMEKRRRRMTDGCLYMQHDNAQPHTAAITTQKLRQLHLNVLPHPPYSLDLAPSDFYLFRPMKSALIGKNFNSSADVQTEIQLWLDTKPSKFFEDGISKLPGRWERCIHNNGNYFEFLSDSDN